MTVESDAQNLTAEHAGTGVVDISTTVHQPVATVWQALISPQGTAIWLGDGAVLGTKGESYHCSDGSSGVVRSYHPLEQVRVSWHAGDDAPASLVEIDLGDRGGETELRLTHTGIRGEGERTQLEERWLRRLEALAEHVGG